MRTTRAAGLREPTFDDQLLQLILKAGSLLSPLEEGG